MMHRLLLHSSVVMSLSSGYNKTNQKKLVNREMSVKDYLVVINLLTQVDNSFAAVAISLLIRSNHLLEVHCSIIDRGLNYTRGSV